MFRCEDDEVRAVDRVDAGREDFNRGGRRAECGVRGAGSGGGGRLHVESHARAFGAADPVALHREHLVGPLAELPHSLQQLVRVVRDLEEPLLQLTRLDDGSAAPARAVDHLLVRKDGVTARTPVHRGAFAVRELALQHLQEDPLVPVVVLREAGRDLAVPRIADPEPLELPLHVGDVFEGPGLRMRPVLDGGVLGRQAKGVPPERVEDVEPAHAFHTRDDVADHVIADVPDVRVPRRIGKHLEAVEFRLRRILRYLERSSGRPAFLPLALDGLGLVIGHDLSIIESSRGSRVPSERAKPAQGRTCNQKLDV